MKNTITILFVLLISSSFLFAQKVQRDKVLVEISTGTWCPYCPGAAMGADDLIANGHDVAIIKNHGGDDYENAASGYRNNSYYGVQYFPTAIFDGGSWVEGGSATQSLYPQYLTKYNQKIIIPTSFSIDIQGSSSGLIDYEVDVTVVMEDPYTPIDLRLHCAVTESDIEENWQGMSHLNNVQRMMLPNYTGIQLDFSGGDTVVQHYSFSLDPSWVAENCEIVIFLQENASKEVLNASKKDMMEFGNVNDYDIAMTGISQMPENTCSGMFSPRVEIRNHGNEELNSLMLKCVVDGNEVASQSWTGSLAFLESAEVTMPEFTVPVGEENTITVYAESPNGNADQFPKNDTIHAMIPGASAYPSDVGLMILLDDHPEETTWELLDEQGNVLYAGGPYSQANGTIMESFDIDDNACYQFHFYDAGGNGLDGNFFALYHSGGTIMLRGENDFGSYLGTDFSTDSNTGLEETADEADVSVYPNPFSNHTNIRINTAAISHIRVKMYNMLGELVYSSDEGMHPSGERLIRMDGTKFDNGIYFLQLLVNDQVITRKLTLAR